MFSKKYKNVFLPTKSWKKHLKKLHTYGSWEFFFSAAPTAQNSPELIFQFINSFIQSSLSRADLIYIEKSMRCIKQLALLYGNLIMMVYYVKYKVSSLPQYIYWDGKLLASLLPTFLN